MQVRFMVLEASDVDDSQGPLVVKTVTEYLTIAEVGEIKFHSEYLNYDKNQVIIELIIESSTRYFLPVLPATMEHFINLSNGISFDWSGYYAARILPSCGRINSAEVNEAMARNVETWKLHEEAINDGYTE